jgi:hypothetical protein
MSHDSHFEGDSFALTATVEGDMELECGNDPCRFEQSVVSEQQYSHGITSWQAEWICKACGESNSDEGWFDPNDNN